MVEIEGNQDEGDDASGKPEGENVAHVMSRDASPRLDIREDRRVIIDVLCHRRHAP
jgi:hypothetical protein